MRRCRSRGILAPEGGLGVMGRDLPRSKQKWLDNGMPRHGAWRRASTFAAVATLALLGTDPPTLSRAHAQDRSAPSESTTVSVPPGLFEEGLIALGRQTNVKFVY